MVLQSVPAEGRMRGGEIAFLVTMESIIRGRACRNDKEDAPLSVISSSISIYYPHRHQHHRTVSGSRMQFSDPHGLSLPHAQRSSPPFAAAS